LIIELNDITSNQNHASLVNMDDSYWMASKAPIGDISASDYSEYSLSASLTVDSWAVIGAQARSYSLLSGIHIYAVNQSPGEITKPDDWLSIDFSRIFPVNINQSYSITCD